MVDLHDLFVPERTGSYILHEEQPSIIETSASPSIPHLLNGLEQLEIQPEEIQYIIVTHIHLDHAGGVGVLLEHCPNATVVVHPRGARHIANPTKLIQGARRSTVTNLINYSIRLSRCPKTGLSQRKTASNYA